MKIFIGADHRGFALKSKVIKLLEKKHLEVVDVGTSQSKVRSDYPEYSFKVAEAVAKTKDARGILVCLTGIGHSIAANKVPGIRAALCYNVQAAKLSRTHNDSNILILGAKFVSSEELFKIIKVWLGTSFEGGRHKRRIDMIKRKEKKLTGKK